MSAQRIAFCLLALISFSLLSQAQQAEPAPPAILEIYRDQVKPAKLAEYTKLEAEAALACARASTWPYLAMQSMSGPQTEVWYMEGFDSYAAVEHSPPCTKPQSAVWYMEGFDSYAAVEHSGDPFRKSASLGGELNRLMEAKINLVGDARVVFAHYRD